MKVMGCIRNHLIIHYFVHESSNIEWVNENNPENYTLQDKSAVDAFFSITLTPHSAY